MFLQKSCIIFYIWDEFLHFDLHNFSECVNNACIKYAGDQSHTGRRHLKSFLIVLLACADRSKIFFQVLHCIIRNKAGTFTFTYPVTYFLRRVSVLAALTVYISQYKAFGLWSAQDACMDEISAGNKNRKKNPSAMHIRCTTCSEACTDRTSTCTFGSKWQC